VLFDLPVSKLVHAGHQSVEEFAVVGDHQDGAVVGGQGLFEEFL
jgi:hypothetical protein